LNVALSLRLHGQRLIAWRAIISEEVYYDHTIYLDVE